MRRLLILLFAMLAVVRTAHALEVPALTGRVVDHAGILAPGDEARIASMLEAHEKKSGQQFAVLTVSSLEGEPLEDYSLRVVEAWKLGAKERDDGLLLLVVPKERRIRVEVGYGLEGDITDALSSRVIRNVIGPAFRRGDYAGGIEAGLSALMRASTGSAPGVPEDEEAPESSPRGNVSLLFFLALFFLPLFLPLLLGSRRGRRRRGGVFFFPGGGWSSGSRGGGFGGGGGGFGGGGASGSW